MSDPGTDPNPAVPADAGSFPALGVAIHPLDPTRDAEAAAILAACTLDGTPEAGRAVLADARCDPERDIYGLAVGDTLVAVCVTRKAPLSVEITHLAVAGARRRQGYGRACLQDALRRAGKRPLVVETDEAGLGFYRACGFKLVGRRRHPSGAARYRLGWHAPAARPRSQSFVPSAIKDAS